MPTFRGTARDDSWTIVNPGIFTLDGLGGVDTILWGTSLRSDYQMYLGPEGVLRIDSVSGASASLNATLYNIEKLVFDSGRDVVDLRVTFPDAVGQLIAGTAANDAFASSSQNDGINGATGVDTVAFRSTSANYTITNITKFGPPTFSVKDKTGVDGTDTLQNVERLTFSDKKIALDLGVTENAGQTLLLLGTLLPAAVKSPSAVGTILGFFDAGATMRDIFQVAVDIGFVRDLAGGSSNAALSAMIFRNLTGTQADAATVDLFLSYMDGRNASFSQVDLLTGLASFPINQQNIGLVGLQLTGVEYV